MSNHVPPGQGGCRKKISKQDPSEGNDIESSIPHSTLVRQRIIAIKTACSEAHSSWTVAKVINFCEGQTLGVRSELVEWIMNHIAPNLYIEFYFNAIMHVWSSTNTTPRPWATTLVSTANVCPPWMLLA